MLKAINPATDEIIGEYPIHPENEVHAILGKVQSAWLDWRETSFEFRAALMRRAGSILRENKEEYARLMTLEMGKIIRESRAEVEKCAWVCDYYAENAAEFLKDEVIKTDASRSFVTFQPLGIVLAVMPWNFPFWQVFRFAAPALMAGNACVLKHASNVPGSALTIESIFRRAGFPSDLFRTLMIPASQVEPVIRDTRIKAVTLTGSEPAGMQVAAIAGHELKKTVLELGGSDPYIVLNDADMAQCTQTAATARLLNAGQSCIAAKRFIVVESRIKEFEKELQKIFSMFKMGNPLNETTDVGPLARKDLRDELHEQVTKSLEIGARLVTGGECIPGEGAFYLPTIISDVKTGMPLYHEETFGPVMAIISVKNADEAIGVANDSDFGLGGSVWTENTVLGEDVARRIESGAIFVNGMTKSDPRLPFGGVKRSGYGRELSHYGIKEFVNIKTIWIK